MFYFLDDFLKPLAFLPRSIYSCLAVIVSVFGLYVAGRVFKWLWDLLPFV